MNYSGNNYRKVLLFVVAADVLGEKINPFSLKAAVGFRNAGESSQLPGYYLGGQYG